MPFRLMSKSAVDTGTVALGSTNVTTSAWVQVIASSKKACTTFEVINPSNSALQIAVGSSGHEVAIPVTIPPGDTSGPITHEIAGTSRISVKAVDVTANVGTLILNLYG